MDSKDYDAKQAYNKNLSASARLHYLENNIHHKENPLHMESNSQEKSNLLNDNPLAEHASGSFISKHMK